MLLLYFVSTINTVDRHVIVLLSIANLHAWIEPIHIMGLRISAHDV
jgi:hypothetical protein